MTLNNETIDRELTWLVWHDILDWGKRNLRNYPWRTSPDSYKILIAEIMLHRTNADQVNEIYDNFINRYPDFYSIAAAGPDKIKSELHSLGLDWRSELLYKMSYEICENYNGILPLSKEKLMALPGVGRYIASAVLCFGYDLAEPVMDTNVVRIIGRLFGLKVSDSSRRNKKFESIMRIMISYGEPRLFSLSMIDFASKVCTSKSYPKCNICPLREECHYYRLKQDHADNL